MNLSAKNRIWILSAALLAMILWGGLSSCGNKNCSIGDRVFGEPSCSDHRLSWNVSAIAPANCVGSPSSRNLTINCPAGTGTTGMCTALADGFMVVVVLVPNNAGGNFTDTGGTGVTYTTCSQLLTDVQSNLVAGIKGIYTSDNSSGNRLNCDNVSGCALTNSSGCFSGWNSTTMTASGTAAITTGSNVLACAYIDNTPIVGAPAPAAYGAWASPLVPFNNVSGTLNFSNSSPSSWTDAF